MKKNLQKNNLLVCLALLGSTQIYAEKQGDVVLKKHDSDKRSNQNTVVATINTGVTPSDIAITPNNKFAYVVNSNNFGVEGADTITVIDLKTNLVVATISDPSFSDLSTITIDSRLNRAYVTNGTGTTISVIDLATNQVINTITGFDGPSSMVIVPGTNIAYVSNFGTDTGTGAGTGTTVNVVNLANNTITGAPITVGTGPTALGISRNGNFIYALNYGDGTMGTGTLSVIQRSTNMVISTITGFSGPSAIAITPDGRFAYVTNAGSNDLDPIGNTISIVDLQTNTVVNTIPVGLEPSDVVFSSNGRLAYVSNFNTFFENNTDATGIVAGAGTVTIIDTKTGRVVAPTIEVGQSPTALAIAKDNLYVTNGTSNTVSVIPIKG